MVDYSRKKIQDYAMSYWNKDGLHVGTKMYEEYLKMFEIDGDFSGKTVVDIGCGAFGGMLSVIKAEKKIGIDPMAKIFHEKLRIPLKDMVILPEFAEETTLENGLADLIFCCNTLDHVIEPEKVVKQIYRLLKKDGLFFLHVHMRTKAQLNIGHEFAFTEELIDAWFKDLKLIKKQIFSVDPVTSTVLKKYKTHYRTYIGVFQK
ncbi:hypothetical protein ES707_03389 [subsurface metagenome]